MLVEQIRTRVLPKRGIVAAPDEILITLGSQNALYLLTRLLMSRQTRVAVENPGFREAINTFLLNDTHIVPHPVDEEGIVLGETPCDYYYVTPGHQVPTGVTMSKARRVQLLEYATRKSSTKPGRCAAWCIAIHQPTFNIRWPIFWLRAITRRTCAATTKTPRAVGIPYITRCKPFCPNAKPSVAANMPTPSG